MHPFKGSYFTRLCALVVAGALALFWLIDIAVKHTETQMSFIHPDDQRTLRRLAKQAESLFLQSDAVALNEFLLNTQAEYQTWAAVVSRELHPYAGSTLDSDFLTHFTLGRDISWKIHLYFAENPVMDLPFADGKTHFLIRLPNGMRPGNYWRLTYISLQFLLPMLVLAWICNMLYRAIVKPLKTLEHAALAFTQGQLEHRIGCQLNYADREFQHIAQTFDKMADYTEHTIQSQRQFIADFSHEIRTPIARIETALDCIDNHIQPEQSLQRIAKDCRIMRTLAEDLLTLTWLENERFDTHNPHQEETFDLVDLLDCITDDCAFEHPTLDFVRTIPPSLMLCTESRALAHVIENVLRNAARFARSKINIRLSSNTQQCCLIIADDGPGVPNTELDNIFLPFYRAEPLVADTHISFGLGLALCKRQLARLRGSIKAQLNSPTGLTVLITLPLR
jgi:two-component system sensor histidine kinase PfeS